MSDVLDTRAATIRRLFEAKAKAELEAADALVPGSDVIGTRGSLLAEVAAVKGLPGPSEAAGGAAFSGSDGEALEKAFVALGWPSASTFFTVSRPLSVVDPDACCRRVRMQVEAVGARMVVATDAEAAEDVARAFDVNPLTPGELVNVSGVRLLAVDAFEASLASESSKRRAWRHLQAARPDGPIF